MTKKILGNANPQTNEQREDSTTLNAPGLEVLTGLEKLTLHQCEELAKKIGYDKTTFDLCGPLAKKKCRWLDAYFGLFQIVGRDGFIRSNDLVYAQDLWCENVRVEPEPESTVSTRTSESVPAEGETT